MTREEAIEHLEDILRDMWTIDSEVDAINMAIKALEQPEIIRCKDCKYSSPNKVYGCRLERFDTWEDGPRMYSNDFCSYAERKEQDDG